MSVLEFIGGTIALFAAFAFFALLWLAANADTLKHTERRTEHSGSSQGHAAIICGKGYEDLEDGIIMTRHIELRPDALYVHLNGSVVKCLRRTADGCAVLMDINNGKLLTVRGCREYPDGKISWSKCLEVVSTC